MIKKFLPHVWVAIAIMFFFPMSLLADEQSFFDGSTLTASPSSTEGNKKSDIMVLATVNIYDAKIISQQENIVNLTFDLNNREGIQPGIRYGIQLFKKDGKNTVLVDEKVMPETVSLAADMTVKKEIQYKAPRWLSGNYEIWVVSKSDKGLPLGQGNAGEIILSGTNDYVEIKADSCYLTLKNDSENKKYTLNQGVDVTADEQLVANCEVSSHKKEAQNLRPYFETRYRSMFGEVVGKTSGLEVSLGAGETKQLAFDLPKAEKPQSYDVILSFGNNKADEAVSNTVVFHYVLRGESATIQNARLDKDYYTKGELANVRINWTGAADSFINSRLGASEMPQTFLFVTLQDGKGELCASPLEKAIPTSRTMKDQSLSLEVTRDCFNPKLIVAIRDVTGIELDNGIFDVSSHSGQFAFSDKSGIGVFSNFISDMSSIIKWLSVAMLLAIILVYWFRKKRIDRVMKLFIMLIVSGSVFLLCSGFAQADTFVVEGGEEVEGFQASQAVYSVSMNKSNYSPGENATASGSVLQESVCDNGASGAYLEVVFNGHKGELVDTFNGKSKKSGTLAGSVENTSGLKTATFFGQSVLNAGTYYIYYTVGNPSLVTLSARPNPINYGSSSTIIADVQNADGCWGWTSTGESGPQPPSDGSASSGSLITDKTYNLKCWNALGESTSSVTVDVVPLPSVSLTASPGTIDYGQSSTITAIVRDASTCWGWTSSGEFGWRPAGSGSEPTGNLFVNKTYNLECWNSIGGSSGKQSVTVYVNPLIILPPTLSLSAQPGSVYYGESSNLTWVPNNAESCLASGGWNGSRLATGGTEPTGPLTTATTYSMECWNTGGSSGLKSVTVDVSCDADCSCAYSKCVPGTCNPVDDPGCDSCSDGCNGNCDGLLDCEHTDKWREVKPR